MDLLASKMYFLSQVINVPFSFMNVFYLVLMGLSIGKFQLERVEYLRLGHYRWNYGIHLFDQSISSALRIFHILYSEFFWTLGENPFCWRLVIMSGGKFLAPSHHPVLLEYQR